MLLFLPVTPLRNSGGRWQFGVQIQAPLALMSMGFLPSSEPGPFSLGFLLIYRQAEPMLGYMVVMAPFRNQVSVASEDDSGTSSKALSLYPQSSRHLQRTIHTLPQVKIG